MYACASAIRSKGNVWHEAASWMLSVELDRCCYLFGILIQPVSVDEKIYEVLGGESPGIGGVKGSRTGITWRLSATCNDARMQLISPPCLDSCF